VLSAEQLLHTREIGPSFVDSHARFQPANAADETGLAIRQEKRLKLRWNPNVSVRARECTRENADNRVAIAADHQP
jgi:hypothetical protein